METEKLEVQPEGQNLLGRLSDIPCEKHSENPITKICKHPNCNGHPPFCSSCLLDHDIMHFSFLEDIETLVNPQKISQVKEMAQILKERLEQYVNEDGASANSSSTIAQFRNCIEENKARLKQCLINSIISKKDDGLKLELKMISDRICRKFVLLAEMKGEDPYLIKDYLLTYAHGMARLSEITEMIRGQSAIAKTTANAKNYLRGVEEILESVRRYTRPIIGELPLPKLNSSRRRSGLRMAGGGIDTKEEDMSRMEDSSNLADNEYNCKLSDSTPRRSMSRKVRRNFLTSGKEPKLYKKLKYNPDRKPSLTRLSKISASRRELDFTCKISGN